MTYSFKQSINLTLPILLVLLLGTPTQATASIDTTALVGGTAGSFSVNQGAANYAIPITVPPGIAGMQPKLSINYNSNVGNGQLGVGFSLSGLSAIHRCAKTIVTDGVKGGVNYNNNDRYCLNGQRLIAISGTDGQSGSEYRTRINDFSRIKYNGNYWSVETKSGQTFEYGSTQTSKIQAQGIVRLWVVNKITDASDNAINYFYTQNYANGKYKLNSIRYANNNSIIRFTYEDRDDVSTSYQAGRKLQQTKRLSNITIHADHRIIRTYDLEYQYRGIPKRSQLSSIEECVYSQCLPKTKFSWKISDAGWLQADDYTPEKSIIGVPPKYSDSLSIFDAVRLMLNGVEQGVRLRDVNGDGLVDFIYSQSDDRKTYLNTGSGWSENSNYQLNEPIINDEQEDLGVRFLDVNGDGLLDYIRGDSDYKKVYLNTGNGWQLSTSFVLPHPIVRDYDFVYRHCYDVAWGAWTDCNSYNKTAHNKPSGMRFAELNGDGLIDIVYGHENDKKAYLNTGKNWVENHTLAIPINISKEISGSKYHMDHAGYEQMSVKIADINNDGLSDIIKASDDIKKTYINQGGKGWKLSSNYALPKAIQTSVYTYNSPIVLLDINSDGLVDMLYGKGSDKSVYLNTGKGWSTAHNFTLPKAILTSDDEDAGTRFIDINGDGLIDVVNGFKTTRKVYLNNGSNWVENDSYTIPVQIINFDHKDAGTRFIDLNGDGLIDILKSKNNIRSAYINQGTQAQLTSIANGFGIQTTINYKPLTDSSVYTKDANSNYPDILIQNARQVVSSVITDNAINGKNTTVYKYGNAKINTKGRGSLGFGWIEKKDLQSTKLTRTQYNQTYPHIGQPTSNNEYIEQNDSRQLLHSQDNRHSHTPPQYSGIFTPYLAQSQEKSYDFNSGGLLTTITTQQFNIDNYGNVGTIKVTTTGENKTFIETTQNTYNNNATKWHLGRLTASTVTHQAPNIPNIIRTSRFAYNNKGLLKSETIEPNTSKALIITYKYDSFGNKIKATTSASGIASRSTTTEYSANGKFPIKTTNALGHSETRTFNRLTGNILTLTGPNNLTTTWQYDTLGRKKLETRADSTTTSTHYQWAEDESPNSLYKITTTTSGSSPKTTYFDAFNRKVREQHTGFDGRKINSDTYYDNLGRVDRASLPYFTDEQGYFITTQYDAIGRLISSTKPADYGNTATNSTTYNGFTTINTNALGYQKTTTKNAIGKIIRIDEPESAWLTHQHDAIGNLTQTNVGGVTTTMSYDNRGNKISMNDPDMGRWTYTYNALGELISQTDAKNQTSTTSYDKLGRMTQRVEPEGTTNWQYDTKTNGIGKLAKVTAPLDYKKEYSYDSLGRIGTTTTHVNNQSFNIQNQYDQYSRLSTQTRPQNFKVENVYNQYGYLMAKRAPKDQISDYDWEHLTKLTQDSLVNVEEALTKANEFEEKANTYLSRANRYRQYADYFDSTSTMLTKKAQELRNNADLLEEVVVRLQKEAKQYTDSAKNYLIAARRFQHLSNVNVADDQERSYIDSNTNSKTRGVDFYSGGSIAAQSNTNGYAWCSNQAACVYWANASKQYAIINTNQAKQKLELAQRYINSSGVEKQAFANHEADNYDKKANEYTRYAVNHIDLSNEYLEQAQESVNQAKYWRGVAANAPDYQAMLADTNNIYFWRAKSRDASGRLTGHIVGNGLSTEQQYSPATGHLFAIKSGFGNTDGIRSLEYEYDLMNNVTQRQNHQSGLTEDFQYDELDRLTQSNTTGNIEGVTYNNGTSYQYDINGNITHKSDIGYYHYNPQRPHAIASINSNSPSSTDDYNANTATTGILTINSSVTGNIETGNDTDWFKITLTAGQQVTFDLEGKPTQSGTLPDPYLRGIYNNTGTLISNTTNDDSGIGVNSKVIFTASTSNTYYISAGAFGRNTGTYILTAIVTGSSASITPSLSDDYIYDANGNMTKNNNKIIQWTSFNKPKRFTKSNSNDNTTFVYAPNRSRYQKTQTKASSNTTITTTYIGKLYEQIKQNTSTEHKHFIYADGQLIAINIKTDTTAGTPPIPDKTRYLHYDNLGSIDTITNGQGNIVERMAYTAFGQRRQGDGRASDPLLPIIPALTNRGFTGHEHIDEMGFIHMNGRVYDPSIGRFLSADPTIQHPYNTQDYNRYSYTTNNPLKYVDMNGFSWLSKTWGGIWKAIKKHDKVILSTVIAYYIGYYASENFLWGSLGAGSSVATSTLVTQSAIIGGAAGGAAFGASNTLLHGGSTSDALNAAAKGSVAGAITGGIAGSYGDVWSVQRIGASAIGSGVSAELQGGSFEDGFKDGIISASLRHLYNKVSKFDVDGQHGKISARFKDKDNLAFANTNNISHLHMADTIDGKLYQVGQLVPDRIIDKVGGEGGFFSNVLNVAPFGINAVSGFHDNMYSYFGISFNNWTNVPGMPLAAFITYGAMADKYGINAQLSAK
ncbi:hypothetical protein [uncultured Gammaproteobacteria bacterium]|nr:hypothetical protein [uncultured Gammaproteobacteria bacterium]